MSGEAEEFDSEATALALRILLAQLHRDGEAMVSVLDEFSRLRDGHLMRRTVWYLAGFACMAWERLYGRDGAISQIERWALDALDARDAPGE